ncbi:MAG TPA: anti-sigma factor antagonist [Flavobacteriales bacterium]|jgi:anti-anti-sigma factor|nr:anti-sigma factor antagonist [Flavobacteriales bacterium]HIA13119.1 anti-sigma factor antagonist [Flavobacteriales bacterium]HIO73048.1 anti-sigma factor antagonist [Flavobacteriales bacterium]
MENFTVDKQERYTLVSVHVEKLDSRVSPALKSELVLVNSGGEKNIIMNLEECRYCDSSGLSAVLIGNRICNENSGTFVLSGLQESVQKLISISQLDTVLTIAPTLDEAIQLVYLDDLEKDINKGKE